MNGGLLAPLVLAALSLGAVAILAHRTGQKALPVRRIATLRFVPRDEVPVRQRRRLEDLLLLALRLLVLIALVLLFARPWLKVERAAPAGFDPSRPVLIVLDRSASMMAAADGRSALVRAQEAAQLLLTQLDAGTLVGLLSFDSVARVEAPGLVRDAAAVARALDAVEVGHGGSDLDAAFALAQQVLAGEGIEEASIIVLTDGTATRLPTPQPQWPVGWTVEVHDVLPGAPVNRWIDEVSVVPAARLEAGWNVKVLTRRSGEEPTAPALRLDLGDGVSVEADLEFERPLEVERSFSIPKLPEGGSPEARLDPDTITADDRAPIAFDIDRDIDVLLLSGEGGASPRDDEVYYLERALRPREGHTSRVTPRRRLAEEVRRIDGGRGDVVVLANVSDPAPLADDLLAFVERGGGLLLAVGPQVLANRWNESLQDLLPAPLSEVKNRGAGTFDQAPAGLMSPPMDRPELRVFRTGGASVFPRVRFGRVYAVTSRMAPGAEVWLRYSDGLPALLARSHGQGRVLLFTSSLDDDWTDLPLRSIYVPLVHQLVRGLAGALGGGDDRLVEAGTRAMVEVPTLPGARAFLVDPLGGRHDVDPLLADSEGQAPSPTLDQAGLWTLRWEEQSGADSVVRGRFRVRVPAAESALEAVDPAALLGAIPGLRWRGPAAEGEDVPSAVVLRPVDLLGPLCLVLCLSLAVESALRLRKAA